MVLAVVLTFIAVVTLIWVAATNPGLLSIEPTNNPDYGGEFQEYVERGGTTTFPYIGDERSRSYYRNTPSRRESIPSEYRVWFRTAEAAEERGFSRAGGR